MHTNGHAAPASAPPSPPPSIYEEVLTIKETFREHLVQHRDAEKKHDAQHAEVMRLVRWPRLVAGTALLFAWPVLERVISVGKAFFHGS